LATAATAANHPTGETNMNRLVIAATAATLVALVGAAGGADLWATAVKGDGVRADRAAQRDGSAAGHPDRTGYGGYADAATAGQAYYGWRYPFAPPLAAALAAADEPTKTKSR
jgi:hypothetical protein